MTTIRNVLTRTATTDVVVEWFHGQGFTDYTAMRKELFSGFTSVTVWEPPSPDLDRWEPERMEGYTPDTTPEIPTFNKVTLWAFNTAHRLRRVHASIRRVIAREASE